MDKIIFFILLFYVFSRLSRILKGEGGGKGRQHPPFPRQPHPRPPAQPPPGGERRPGQDARPGPVSRKEEDALQILAEWEKIAQGQKAGQAEIPSEMGEEPGHFLTVSESSPQAEGLASIGYTEAEHGGEESEDVWTREAEKEAIFHLHHPSVLREGIILSEILRPAIVLRPLAPPYRRS